MPRYLALKFSQGEGSPTLLTFVAPAEEIKGWGGIPHKTTTFIGGFQRPLGNRYEQLIAFFDVEGNTSPTSIVVALHPDRSRIFPIKIDSKGIPRGKKINRDASPVIVEIDDPPKDNVPLHKLAEEVYAIVTERTSQEPATEDFDPEDLSETGSQQGDEGPVDDESSDDVLPLSDEPDEWGVNVGASALKQFGERIQNAKAVNAFLADIAASFTPEELEEEDITAEEKAEQELRKVLRSMASPAMIVDGQHRVYGAAMCDHTVPFSVCAIADSDWQQAVFQFIVVNKQARAISGELLASIVNSSLTNHEIGELEKSLEAAGISTYETKMLRTLNDDPDSPFRGLIARGIDETDKKITFKAAIALAGRWKRKMNHRDDVFKTLFRPGLPGSNNSEKQHTWDSEWKKYMFAFWNGIANLYRTEHLWEAGTQLMFRATLETLQDNFLEAKTIAGQQFENPVRLREAVEDFYGNVPAGFFHTEWKRKELLTKDGRKVLKDALNAMRVPGAKIGSLKKKDPLFTGATTSLKTKTKSKSN